MEVPSEVPPKTTPMPLWVPGGSHCRSHFRKIDFLKIVLPQWWEDNSQSFHATGHPTDAAHNGVKASTSRDAVDYSTMRCFVRCPRLAFYNIIKTDGDTSQNTTTAKNSSSARKVGSFTVEGYFGTPWHASCRCGTGRREQHCTGSPCFKRGTQKRMCIFRASCISL